MATRSRLPKTGTHGQQILDRYGNRWEYDAGQKLWLNKGTVTAPTVVTEDSNGIIDGTIYEQLQKLKTYVRSGVNLSPLKLLPGRDAYWYYFRSSNKLIKFRPESEDTLRIEFDTARFFQLIAKQICAGPTGATGIAGPVGLDGNSILDEPCYAPSRVSGQQLDFAIFTATPILNDDDISLPNDHVPEISVRLTPLSVPSASVDPLRGLSAFYKKITPQISQQFERVRNSIQQQALGVKQALCDIPLSEVLTGVDLGGAEPEIEIEIDVLDPTKVEIISTTIPLDTEATLESIQYDPETGIVCGSIIRAESDWEGNWCVKSWQKGPDGFQGVNGNCQIRVVECVVDDTNYLATCPIVNVRLDCERNTLYKLCSGLVDEACVGNVQFLPTSATLTTSEPLDSVFAAAQMSLDECKHINRFEVELIDDSIPALDLVHWDPQPGCFTQRHYNRYKFDWVPMTDVPECASAAKWYSATAVRPGKYPYELITAPRPPADECCADDYFFCPNVQDGPCAEQPEDEG